MLLTHQRREEGHVRSAVATLACLLGVVVIAGCGGGGNGGALSKEDYEEQMQALQADLGQSATELEQAFSNPQDSPAVSDGLNNAADIFEDASASLNEIEPPDDVADPHQVMVDQTASAAERIRGVADRVENAATPAEISNELLEFTSMEELTELEQAVDDIQAAGYDISVTGSNP
jgi:hypothetical protein